MIGAFLAHAGNAGKVGVLQDVVQLPVRPGAGGISRAKDRDNRPAYGGSNVHRASVVGDD